MVEGNLDSEITIGLHLHENLGLAYSLAQHFIEIRDPKRKINIDCSLFGMGRAPGNLCTEQIMDHMNIYQGAKYNTEPALDAIDDFIAPLKRKYEWGYSIPYALSGKYGLHRTYAEFLMNKNRLKTKDIQRILALIDKEHIEMFDEAYIEKLYRNYIAADYDDSDSVEYLKKALFEKDIVIICPGGTIAEYKDEIVDYISNNKSTVISVNFIPDFVETKYVFCANVKRISNIKTNSKIKHLVTSNLAMEYSDICDYVFSFNDCVYFNEVFCEDSTLMLMKILYNCGIKKVSIAGFDGFVKGQRKYFDEKYTNEVGIDVEVMNVKRILSTTFKEMDLNFLTPSAYIE